MKRTEARSLHFHIWIVFAALMLAVGALLSGTNYTKTRESLETATSDTARRIGSSTIEEVGEILGPAEMAVRLVSHSSLADAHTLTARLGRLALLRDALRISPALQAVYVGYANGDFFFLRKLTDDADRATLGAPKEAQYMVQSIARDERGPTGRFIYLDDALTPIGTMDERAYAAQFDPRTRPWYTEAMSSGGLIRTDPYVFYSDRGVGTTIAIPTAARDAVVGGDFRLDGLDRMLARKRSTGGTLIALLDRNERLVASGTSIEGAAVSRNGRRNALLRPAREFGAPVLTELANMAAGLGESASAQKKATIGGGDWYLSVSRVVRGAANGLPSKEGRLGKSDGDGDRLFLVLAIPLDDLLAGAKRQALLAVGLTVLVVLAAIPVTWLLARAISKPLQNLADQADAIRRFEFDETFIKRSRMREVNVLSLAMDEMRLTIRRFLDIAEAMAAEPQLDRLLPMFVRETMQVAGGAFGVLYLVQDQTMEPASAWSRDEGEITKAAGAVPITSAPAFVREAILRGTARTGMLSGDAEMGGIFFGSRTARSPLHAAIIPLASRQRELTGAMLLLRDTPFHAPEMAFVTALAGLTASTLELRELVNAQRELFDAFIRLIAGAIDAKSPHTGGHCARVPELVTLLAKAACEAREGPFADFSMSATDWEALHVAAWLHDCGKVTTPEYVIDKATKLETLYDRIHEIRMRFEVLKRDAEIRCLQARLAGEDETAASTRRDAELRELDDDFAFVAACNQGSERMDADCNERLTRIATRTWLRTLDDRLGVSHEEASRKERAGPAHLPAIEPLLADKPEHRIERSPSELIPEDNPWGFKLNIPELLYDRGELHNLGIARGTLCSEERYKIEEHIVQTQIMLSRLPFPKHLRDVPEIAGNHHETMIGTGYPRRLVRSQMSPLARMMAIADVFEALTAKDRPYKKAKTLSESVRIMASMTERGHIDPDLFELFLASGAYRRYAERFMDPRQVDDVDLGEYIASPREREITGNSDGPSQPANV